MNLKERMLSLAGEKIEEQSQPVKEINEEVVQKATEDKTAKPKKNINEGFDAHVLCNSCGSGNLKLSRKKSKIKCADCGNTGLTESVVGLNEMARTKEQYAKGKEKLSADINKRKAKYMKDAEDSIDRTMDKGRDSAHIGATWLGETNEEEVLAFLHKTYPDFTFKFKKPAKKGLLPSSVTWSEK